MALTLDQQVAELTIKTGDLLDAITIKKSYLDNAAASVTIIANSASASADSAWASKQAATQSEINARDWSVKLGTEVVPGQGYSSKKYAEDAAKSAAAAALSATGATQGQINSDWNETDANQKSFIYNKPAFQAPLGYSPARRANFPNDGAASMAAIDLRTIVNPSVGIGYPAGGRFRFAYMDDASSNLPADVIDMSTWSDNTGGGYNSLYFNKKTMQIYHKFAVADATGWTTKTLAYTDSAITGNAATATKLATPRAINGVNFDGTAAITIADNTKLPLTGGKMQGPIYLQRYDAPARGISWYSDGYPSWVSYMAQAGQTGQGPTGTLVAPNGTLVTSFALRSYIENIAGYGWTFESGSISGTRPQIMAEIRASDGSAWFGGHVYGSGFTTNGGDINLKAPSNGDMPDIVWQNQAGGEEHRLFDSGSGTQGLSYRFRGATDYKLIHEGNVSKYTVQVTNGTSVDVSQSDIDLLTTTGFFRGNACLHAPDNGWWLYQVQSHDNSGSGAGWCSQTATAYGAANTYPGGKVMVRRRTGTATWSAWNEQFFERTMQKRVDRRNNGGPSLNDITAAEYGFAYPGDGNYGGAYLHFGGLNESNSSYACQISTNYLANSSMRFRTQNNDLTPAVWNAWREVWHDGNMNPPAVGAVANSTVQRNESGYLFGSYLNMTDEGTYGSGGAVSAIITKQGDNFYRSTNKVAVKNFLNIAGNDVTSTRADKSTLINCAWELSWKNYDNGHSIFDASAGTSPTGSVVNRTDSNVRWSPTYPSLMGWNGSDTYGVRVDRAAYAENVTFTTLGRVGTAGPGFGSYGSINVAGQTGGYAGISFSDMNMTLMIEGTSQGIYKNDSTWSWRFDNGVLAEGKVPGTNVTGYVGNAKFADVLGSLGNYVHNQATKSDSYALGIQHSFVGATASEGGFPHYGGLMTFRPYSAGGGGAMQMLTGYGIGMGGDTIKFRVAENVNFNWSAWHTIVTDRTIGAYSPTLTGVGASGTWNISILGGASYATSSGSAVFLTGNASTNGADGWFRSTGAAGWYSTDFATGIYATEAGNVRTYNNSSFTATVFYGDGAGLTGTAPSLKAGSATKADTATRADTTPLATYASSAGSAATANNAINATSAVVANRLGGPASTNGSDGWFRSTGNTGWFNSDYNVGIYASETGNVRTYNNAAMTAGTFYGSGAGLTGGAPSLTSGATSALNGNVTATGYTWTGIQQFRANKGTNSYGANYDTFHQFYSDDQGCTGFSLHRGGSYATNVTLDPDNCIAFGGWSAGTTRKFTFNMTNSDFTAQGNIIAYSDERLKTNWRDVGDDFVERWAKVKHGIYDRTDTGQRQAGLGAQSAAKVLPDCVTRNAEGILGLMYGNAAAVASVKLAERCVKLEEMLMKALERIEALENK